MKFSPRFTVAIQILLELHLNSDQKVSSLFLSNKIGVDNTTTRQVMLSLKQANLINNKPGPGGSTLVKELSEISLFDVYIAINDVDESLLTFYTPGLTATKTENEIIETIEDSFKIIRSYMYSQLKNIKLNSLLK